MKSPDEELVDAWGRILNDCPIGGDGEKARIWLRRRVLEVLPMNAEPCAVQDHNGARRLAALILNFAVKSDNDGRTERNNNDTDFSFERRRRSHDAAAGSNKPRGAARRVPIK